MIFSLKMCKSFAILWIIFGEDMNLILCYGCTCHCCTQRKTFLSGLIDTGWLSMLCLGLNQVHYGLFSFTADETLFLVCLHSLKNYLDMIIVSVTNWHRKLSHLTTH